MAITRFPNTMLSFPVRPQMRTVEMLPEYTVLSPLAYRVLWMLRSFCAPQGVITDVDMAEVACMVGCRLHKATAALREMSTHGFIRAEKHPDGTYTITLRTTSC